MNLDSELTEEQREQEAVEAEEQRKIVERAQECYRVGINTMDEWRRQAIQDLEFYAGEQWEGTVKAARAIDGRPVLTVNRLPQFVRLVTNEQRRSEPAITVNPIDDGGTKRTAEVLQGIIRNIEYTSNAEIAYAAGGESAARTGLGFWDVVAEYESERSFDQRLTIRTIDDPLSVVMDPSARELAGDDARWVIISTDITKAEFEARYPELDVPQGSDWSGRGDKSSDWVAKEGVRIHEFRYLDEVPDKLYSLEEASEVLLEALRLAGVDTTAKAVLASELGAEFAAKLEEAGFESRTTTLRKVCWAKIAGDQVIERGELAGRYLQLVRVVGTHIRLNGTVNYEGVIRQAKDTQRALNYAVSAEMEAIALTPKAPWLVAEGQIEGYEGQWKDANARPQAVLTYRAKSFSGGQPVPPPSRVQAEANVAAITQARQLASLDLNEITGIYPSQYGGPAPEQSGIAIQRRVQQGQISNFHFGDNLSQAIRYTGRVLIDLIPKIYTGPRIMRILGEEGEHEMVPVNQPGEFRGEQVEILLDAGRYDVAVTMGPSHQSRRQEAAAQLAELMRASPQLAQWIADLYVRNLDVPGADMIADRLAKMLPPDIRPPNSKTPPQQVLAQQLQQAQLLIQQMTGRLQQLSHVMEVEEISQKGKERIALINAHTELIKVAAQLGSKESQAMLDRAHEMIMTRFAIDNTPDVSTTQGENNGVQKTPNTAP